jgi:hypothetical protein
MFQIDKLSNHVVYNNEKIEGFYKLAKNLKILKTFSNHILAVRRANYTIKRAQDIGLWLILQFHHV